MEQWVYVAAGGQPAHALQHGGGIGCRTGTACADAVPCVRDKSGLGKACGAEEEGLVQRQVGIPGFIPGGEACGTLHPRTETGHLDDLSVLLHLVVRDGAVTTLVVDAGQHLQLPAAPEFQPLKE